MAFASFNINLVYVFCTNKLPVDLYMLLVTDKNPLRGGMLLAKVAEMKRCNIEHQEMALLMKQECSQLAFGVLWTEVFVQR